MLLLFLQILDWAAVSENLVPNQIRADETDRGAIISRRAVKMIMAVRSQHSLSLNSNILKMTKSSQSVNAEDGEAADVEKDVAMRDGVDIAEQNDAETNIIEELQDEKTDTSANNIANEPASLQSQRKPRKRAKPKAVKANNASDIAESEADAAQLVAKADAPEQGKDRKKKVAKTKTKAKKKTGNDKSKKPSAKAKKTSKKAKTKAAKSKSTKSARYTEGSDKLANSADIGQEKGATSDKERSPKSSVEMTVINIDDTLGAKTKKKGWWSR